MIKAIVFDVDGVLKGSKEGINFPIPHADVIQKLKTLREEGIPVILCSGNYLHSILKIIQLANLRNPHISDRGALIVDPLDGVVLEKHLLQRKYVKEIIKTILSAGFYMEVYSDNEYFVQKSQVSELTKKRTVILQEQPVLVDSFEEIFSKDIIKINIFSKNEEEKEKATKALSHIKNEIAIVWLSNPATGTMHIANVTSKDISKPYAVQQVLQRMHINSKDVLGVGDTLSDWEFMSLCGYTAAMGNADSALKELVKTKGEGKYFIAPHVDDNGVLEALKHFSL
ncbi:MAG TPA: HAD family hydrolase [Candidatus Eisenbacteria bacterium]|nr:HAD family hydrolase [Candidatus Eisenbacteria bacterium]